MRIKMGYDIGYAGTASEWKEEVPQDVIDEGKEALEAYIEETRDSLWREVCEKISVWVKIEED